MDQVQKGVTVRLLIARLEREGVMGQYSEIAFKSYLLKGQLRAAVDYLGQFPDKSALLQQYIDVFEKGQYQARTSNNVIARLDQIYQDYYRNVFWRKMRNGDAKETLFRELWRLCGGRPTLPKDSSIEDEIEMLVKAEGYHYLGGDTQSFYGPYIWKSSTEEAYEVELPSGIEPYSIVMMDGFISRSWLDFISFGITGTGGWAGKDGTLCCVRNLWDIESSKFQIVFLKHEAQHAYDHRTYQEVSSLDLEYRAKLVELIYWRGDERIRGISNEADDSNPANTHSMAAYRIIMEMSQRVFGCNYIDDASAWEDKMDTVRKHARQMLDVSSCNL
jgi:hypothetical protein